MLFPLIYLLYYYLKCINAIDNNAEFLAVDLNDILLISAQYIYLAYSLPLAYYDEVLYNFVVYILNNFTRFLLNVCAETV